MVGGRSTVVRFMAPVLCFPDSAFLYATVSGVLLAAGLQLMLGSVACPGSAGKHVVPAGLLFVGSALALSAVSWLLHRFAAFLVQKRRHDIGFRESREQFILWSLNLVACWVMLVGVFLLAAGVILVLLGQGQAGSSALTTRNGT